MITANQINRIDIFKEPTINDKKWIDDIVKQKFEEVLKEIIESRKEAIQEKVNFQLY